MPLWNIKNARIQQLVVFKIIFEQRSITKTADILGFTQSSVISCSSERRRAWNPRNEHMAWPRAF